MEVIFHAEENKEPEVLLPEEVAAVLRINIQTVLIKLRKGELKGFKIGSYWRVNRTDLNEYRGL